MVFVVFSFEDPFQGAFQGEVRCGRCPVHGRGKWLMWCCLILGSPGLAVTPLPWLLLPVPVRGQCPSGAAEETQQTPLTEDAVLGLAVFLTQVAASGSRVMVTTEVPL